MLKILMATEKLITSTTENEWLASGSKEMVLFTSAGNKNFTNLIQQWDGKIFQKIYSLENYASNDAIELEILQLAKKVSITKIIPLTEADILRAARLRKKLNIPGQDLANAVLFRNKILMKQHAVNHGIKVPRYKCIKNTIDLIEFIERANYPVVIKPIMGRGSLDTFVINNKKELEEKLNLGFISNTSRYPDLLAEEYIEGEIYHIDGLKIDNKIVTLSFAKYINNCLSFVNGSFLGSHTLDDHNPIKQKLSDFCYNQILQAFPLPLHSLIHIEIFLDKQGVFWLCEIACRIGGNGINDEVKLQQGIDIKMAYIRAENEISSTSAFPNLSNSGDKVAARLLIPPTNGRLAEIPDECPFPEVIRYQPRGKVGCTYQKMRMSNDEIANFLLVGDDEKSVQTSITQLASWFYQNTRWEIL